MRADQTRHMVQLSLKKKTPDTHARNQGLVSLKHRRQRMYEGVRMVVHTR